jgi:hypothetical protein
MQNFLICTHIKLSYVNNHSKLSNALKIEDHSLEISNFQLGMNHLIKKTHAFHSQKEMATKSHAMMTEQTALLDRNGMDYSKINANLQ